MSEPNTWTSATVLNNWGGAISNVQLKHRYDNDHYDDKSWDSIENGKQGDSFQVGYWTGFGRTGYDYWLIKFEADGKTWTCKDNFYCFLTDDDKGGTVQCRVYKDGDDGKMEVICPQSSHATVSLSSQALPSTSPGCRTQCDGTIVPRKDDGRAARQKRDPNTKKMVYWVPIAEHEGGADRFLPRVDGDRLKIVLECEASRKDVLDKAKDILKQLQSDIEKAAARRKKDEVISKALGKYLGLSVYDGGAKYDIGKAHDREIHDRLSVVIKHFEENREYQLDATDYYFDDDKSANYFAIAGADKDYPPYGRFRGIIFSPDYFEEPVGKQAFILLHEYFHLAVPGGALDHYENTVVGEYRGDKEFTGPWTTQCKPMEAPPKMMTFEQAANMAICLGAVAIFIVQENDWQDHIGCVPYGVAG